MHDSHVISVYYSFKALHGLDVGCADYIGFASKTTADNTPSVPVGSELTLEKAIISGLKASAVDIAGALLETEKPLDVINGRVIPALNEIGKAFEEKRAYLPQLLMSAEAASAAFEVIKSRIEKKEADDSRSVILATVKGDIHDIGKNIVRVLLESYGFKVYDLGRDVSPERILEAVKEKGCRLVGLSALMTTTVPAMEETISLLHSRCPDVKVMVGGAVLNGEYAEMIKADYYGPDAMEAVRITESIYGRG